MYKSLFGISALLLLGLGLSGCGKSAKKAAAASASPSSSVAPVARAPGFDETLFTELSQLTKTCKVVAAEGAVNCAQGEQRQLISELVSNQRPRNKSIATFAAALRDQDVSLRAVAANILNGAFRSPWGPDASVGSVQPADADALLAATLQLPKVQARQAIPAAVHACMLSGRKDALYSALDKAEDSEVRIIATRYLMTHGRLDAFKRVLELSKDPNSSVVLAALESPRNMYSWTASEQSAICPWATEFLADQRPAVAAKAAGVLSSCSGEWVDKLLDAGEKALADKSFNNMQLGAFRDLCAPHQLQRDNGPSAAQCKRSRALLAKIVDSSALDEQVRSTALSSIAYQWPDEDTMKLARKESKAKEATLAEVARRTVERLEQRGKLTTTKPEAPGHAHPAGGAVRPAVAPAAAPAAPPPAE